MSTVINLRHWAYCAGLTSEGTSAVPATVLNSIADQLEAAEKRVAELESDNASLRQVRADLSREANTFEAELARRDAVAGEPDGYIFLHPNGKLFWSVSQRVANPELWNTPGRAD